MLFWFFVLAVAVQCCYALYFFTRIFNFPRQSLRQPYATEPVSIIICAKNEADNLARNLPSVLTQRYTNEAGKLLYEVIVLNDASDDNTEEVLYQLEQQFSHLWHVTISKEEPRLFKGKKFALGLGVQYATYSRLLLTDADCTPASDQWLAYMTAPFDDGKEIVAGYGAYRHAAGMLNTFIRWETMHTFLQYSTFALAGMPYMAVGRNLACTKEVFQRAQQSEVWNKLPSGDDDLLMQCCATKANTAIVAHRDAFTYSDAKENRKEWLFQKQRHVSTGKFYTSELQALLGAYALSHALSWILFFVLMLWHDWFVVFVVMAMRCAIYWTIWQSTASRLQDKKLFPCMPWCDAGWMIYNVLLSPYIFLKSRQRWR